jgi:hypothetical protein
LIREAYKHHWEIIKDHFKDGTGSCIPVVISGTPGIGKSVEGFFFIYQIFDTFDTDTPPIIYVDNTQKGCIIYFRGNYYNHPNFGQLVDLGGVQAYGYSFGWESLAYL